MVKFPWQNVNEFISSDNDYELGEDLFYITEFEEESIKRNKFSSKPRRL